MAVTREDVEKIALLARLQITPDDEAKYTDDLNNILGLIEQMNAINTDGVDPMAHPLDETQPLRKDKITAVDERELFQQQAPLCEAGLYLVPEVIEKT